MNKYQLANYLSNLESLITGPGSTNRALVIEYDQGIAELNALVEKEQEDEAGKREHDLFKSEDRTDLSRG